MKNTLKIEFASNLDLAKKIFHILVSYFCQINTLNFDLELNEDQCSIIINTKYSDITKVKNITKDKLRDIFKNDSHFSDYKISEFENIIIVAKIIDLEKITNFLSCEICGYKTNYEEDLFIHRYTHAGL